MYTARTSLPACTALEDLARAHAILHHLPRRKVRHARRGRSRYAAPAPALQRGEVVLAPVLGRATLVRARDRARARVHVVIALQRAVALCVHALIGSGEGREGEAYVVVGARVRVVNVAVNVGRVPARRHPCRRVGGRGGERVAGGVVVRAGARSCHLPPRGRRGLGEHGHRKREERKGGEEGGTEHGREGEGGEGTGARC